MSNLISKATSKYRDMPVQLKASLWFLICSVLQKGVSVITTPIFTRLMSSAEYGSFNVFISWQGIVTAIVILTLPWGVYEQGLVKFSDRRDAFSSSMLGLMTALSLSGLVIYLPLRHFFNHLLSLSTVQMLCMFSLMWSTSVFSFWAMRERVDFKYRRLVAMTLAVTLVKPIVGIILVLNNEDKVTARIMGLTVIELLFFTGLFVSMMKAGRSFFSKKIWAYGLRFNLTLVPHYLSQRLLNNADRIMIERMVSAGAAGIYSLAYSLALLMQLVNIAVRDTISPWTFKKIKAGREADIPRVAYPAMIIVAAVNLLLIAFAPEVVRLFAPTEYYDAVWVIPPVTMSVYFMFLYSFFADFEFYFERTQLMSVATFSGAAVNILLNLIFIRIFGYYAAGYTTLVCYVLYAVMHYILMRKICNDQYSGKQVYDLRIILSISLAFVLSGFGIMLTYNNVLVRYAVIAAIVISAILFRNRVIAVVKQIRGKEEEPALGRK